MKKLIITLLALAFCLGLTSCGDEISFVSGVKNTVYENDGSDMVSFYMTSDAKSEGIWNYTLEGENFEIFAETEEIKKHGSFDSQKASFKTLILKPTDEGSAKIVFECDKNGDTKEYTLTVTKDENKVLRIKVE